jgi:hypothetical protein
MEDGLRLYDVQQTKSALLVRGSLPPDFFMQTESPLVDFAGLPVHQESRKSSLQELPASAEELDRTEVEVEWVLHRLGLCLDGTVRTEREGNGVTVSGSVETSADREELARELSAIRHVKFEVRAVEESAKEDGSVLAAQGSPTIVVRDMRPPLEGQMTGDRSLAADSREVVSLSEAVMAEAWALRHVAERYPDRRFGELGRKEQQLLSAILREHSIELEAKSARLATKLSSLPNVSLLQARIPASDLPEEVVTQTNWNEMCQELFRQTAAVNETLHAVFAGTETVEAKLDIPLSRAMGNLSLLQVQARTLRRLPAANLLVHDIPRGRRTDVK